MTNQPDLKLAQHFSFHKNANKQNLENSGSQKKNKNDKFHESEAKEFRQANEHL